MAVFCFRNKPHKISK